MDTLDKIKELASLVQKVGDIDLYRRIVELQGEVVELSTRNFRLEKKCAELEGELNKKKALSHHKQLYFSEGDPIPYCPRCWETNDKLIHLFRSRGQYAAGVHGWECHTCLYDYFTKGDEEFHPQKTYRRC